MKTDTSRARGMQRTPAETKGSRGAPDFSRKLGAPRHGED